MSKVLGDILICSFRKVRFSLDKESMAITCPWASINFYSALDKLLGQLGIYATWLSSIAYLQKQLRIFIFF